ncbi:MAG TPA: hypothetical protein VFB82_21430 [Blastocatellia bacterium]|nr:hypothetical protein [Blastocatellia bacterium]
MSSRDAFSDLRRSKEEEFFRKREAELLEKMKLRLRLEAEKKELADVIGSADEDVLAHLQELGFTRDTVLLLHLVPLVAVAWADGSIAVREREAIFEVARHRGINSGSTAYDQLAGWLNTAPPEEFFREALRIISILLGSLPPEEQEAGTRDLVSYSTLVASAAGGILGIGPKVSSAERAVIESIAAELERNHQDAAARIVKD